MHTSEHRPSQSQNEKFQEIVDNFFSAASLSDYIDHQNSLLSEMVCPDAERG